MKVHLQFARDFKEAGNDAMAQYHLDKASSEQELQFAAECDLFCNIIETLFDSGPESISTKPCRDPVTYPPSGPAPSC